MKKKRRDVYKDLFDDKLSPEEKVNLVISNLDQLVVKQTTPFSSFPSPFKKADKKPKDDASND